MKIVLIHGFNVKDNGAGSVDRLKPYLQARFPDADIDTDTADYGWDWLFKVHFFYMFGDTIKRIAQALKSADVVITHSNGANYCMKALKRISNRHLKVVHLSPALNRGYKFRKRVFWSADIFHTLKDKIVGVSKFIPFSPWGDMGQVGSSSSMPYVRNHDWTKTINGHSDWFKDEHVEAVANGIADQL